MARWEVGGVDPGVGKRTAIYAVLLGSRGRTVDECVVHHRVVDGAVHRESPFHDLFVKHTPKRARRGIARSCFRKRLTTYDTRPTPTCRAGTASSAARARRRSRRSGAPSAPAARARRRSSCASFEERDHAFLSKVIMPTTQFFSPLRM